MKMQNWKTLCLIAAMTVPGIGLMAAEMSHDHPMAPKSSEALEHMKTLAGSWEGPNPMAKDGSKLQAEYRVTGGGSAVEERLMAGTPMEMVTMYYDQGGSMQLTHYCSLGNHPSMKLMKSEPAKMEFSLVDGTVASADEMHMHALTPTMPDKDHLVQAWTLYEKGKQKDIHTFNLTRKKA